MMYEELIQRDILWVHKWDQRHFRFKRIGGEERK